MAHYAFLDDNNIVIEVIVGKDETETIDGLTPERWYENYRDQKCVRTSYNAAQNGFRGNYAGIGYSYLADHDIFMPPKCHAEATLDSVSAKWDCNNEEHNVKPLTD